MTSILEPNLTSATEPKPRKYPYLGKFPDGGVVLFIHRRRGICVHGEEIGQYSYRWDEARANPLDCGITLKNNLNEIGGFLPPFKTDSVYC
jgi:hypothetical protein